MLTVEPVCTKSITDGLVPHGNDVLKTDILSPTLLYDLKLILDDKLNVSNIENKSPVLKYDLLILF
jgi:hypothetical protein